MSAKRVVIVGAESTGKTTLAQDLAGHYGCLWVPEYGRAYTEEKYRRDGPDAPWASDEFVHIAERQQQDEDRAAELSPRLVVCDTDAWATGLWHERYMGSRDPATDAVGTRRRADAYVLAGLDVPFEPDDIRDGEDYREWMHAEFKRLLEAGTVPWVEATGPREERVARLVPFIDALLGPSLGA